MSRRKHAWAALDVSLTDEEQRAVETAVIEDCTDDLHERLGELEELLREAGAVDTLAGVLLAGRELRDTLASVR